MSKKRITTPAYLDSLAVKYWKTYQSDVNLDDKYLYETLGQLCLYLSEFHRSNDQIVTDGMVVETTTTKKIHPCVAIKNQAQTMIQRLSKVLFSPQKQTGHIQADELTDFFGE